MVEPERERVTVRPDFNTADALLADLRWLCRLPTTTTHTEELQAAARALSDWLWRSGFEVQAVPTATAPVLIATRAGRSQRRVLLYHHYDVMPPGPWRAWSHEPFELAERDAAVYARGVAHGKGPLAAQMHALQALIRTEQELPVGVVLVLEGDAMQGSPHLAEVVAQHADLLRADICLSTAGERDGSGVPFCYLGSKGLLQLELEARGAAMPLDPGLAASVSNPAWRLIWALSNIKGDDEDIRIEGFYDAIAGPRRTDRDMLRAASLDEAGRRAAWQIDEFLFNMSGNALIRSQTTLPTCNVSAFVVEPGLDGAYIPTRARARLDLQLVPDQTPDSVLAMIQKHLDEKGLGDITITRLPGAYAPAITDVSQPLVQLLGAVGEPIFGHALPMLPFGPFAQPLHLFAAALHVPTLAVALVRSGNAVYTANERVAVADLLNHSRLLAEFLLHMDQTLAAAHAE